MSLSGKTLANTYKDLLQLDNSNNGVDTTTRSIKDGEGTTSALSLSDDVVSVKPQSDNTTATFLVENSSGTDLLVVDSTNSKVSALGNYVNTQYAYFGIGAANAFADDTHHPIPFGSYWTASDVSNSPAFGTGTDPATSFTTAEGSGTRASDIVTCLWYVQDAISIDAVTGIEGADTATGDTTRMHLFSYDFTSGSTSCLTNGTLLARNSDVTNAGSEQAYLSSFTIDSASVAAGKVILAFFKSDSINSDYSINIKVKYHLT
tara:strand:- start:1282 stop:2067 length:786 start_codon:yes stop_codon:yes gene_type:complete